jgi:predicted ATP-grasp superfamily ATP-dependent carboligase
VLVTDGGTRAALALTRGLGRAGYPVSVSADARRSLAGASRHCVSRHAQAAIEAGPVALAASLLRAIEACRADVVLGVTDATLTVLHALQDRLLPARLGPPPADRYLLASDKVRLFELAGELGVPVPPGFVVRGGDVPPVEALSCLGPSVVVRPALSWRIHGGAWVRGTVTVEASRAALARRVERDAALHFPYLVQRRIEGQGCGLFLLAASGALLRTFAHRRLREKPPEGGVSTLCESVMVPADLAEVAVRWAAAMRWTGLAMLEFKRDASDGTAYLLEVNARPWGSLALAAASGLELPADLMAVVRHATPDSPIEYRPGVRLRWWWGDVDQFFLQEKAAGRSGWGAVLRGLARATVAGPWPDAWDTGRWDDPAPFVAETLDWARA